ncbi:MAG: bifunctional riboflavin kinase/FAD synthetase [Thiotrichaceae bacterium]|nr:bifunctional riboflavin kinase/FAD synthetase [Thiotrichaceae bacterium]
MRLLRTPDFSSHGDYSGCVATIGNFDGVHTGHRDIISRVIQQAKEKNLKATIISFEPLPTEFFCGQFDRRLPRRIYPFRDKLRLISELAIDHYVSLKFSQRLCYVEAADFIHDILLKKLKVKHLIVGDDFRFGKGRTGDYTLLQSIGAEHGMTVEDSTTTRIANGRVSSTRIREYLFKGDIKGANKLLSHPYQLSGRIVNGDKRGRTIGFPTLNQRLPENIAVAKGVYAVKIYGLDNAVHYGVANVGTRPTVAGIEMRLESHVFDFEADVYGRCVNVELVNYIRPEKKFDDFGLLMEQIQKDAKQARDYFSL